MKNDAYIVPEVKGLNHNSFVPYIFTHEQIASVIKASDETEPREVVRNMHLALPVIFRILYGCGLRVSEVVGLRYKDVNLEDGILTIREAKTDRDRYIPLSDSVKEACISYADKTWWEKDSDFFFPAPDKTMISPMTVYQRYRRYLEVSLSVSDVVIMNQNGDMKAFFVDRFGFQELPDFVEERKKILGMESDIQKKDVLEQTSCISFYAAECSEFLVLGEVHHDLTLPEALEAYEKIPAERMNGLKSVGFNLQEGSDYDGMMDLMIAGRSQREILDSIPFYRENKLVQEALKRVEQYIREKPLNVEKTRSKGEKGEIQKTKSQKRREDMSL